MILTDLPAVTESVARAEAAPAPASAPASAAAAGAHHDFTVDPASAQRARDEVARLTARHLVLGADVAPAATG